MTFFSSFLVGYQIGNRPIYSSNMQMMGSSTNCVRTRPPPAYNTSVAQMAARMHRLGRAHSHEGVTSTYYLRDDDDDDGNLIY